MLESFPPQPPAHQGPFFAVPVNAGFGRDDIYTFAARPEYIVHHSFRSLSLSPDQYSVEQRHAELTGFLGLLDELREDFSIPNSGADIVIGPSLHNPDWPVDYVVSGRISDVGVMDNLNQIPKEEVYAALANLVNYYAKSVMHGGTFIGDLGLRQCMYGTVPKDPAKKIRLHDLQDLIFEHPPIWGDDTYEHLAYDLNLLGEELDAVEQAHGKRYDALRERIEALLAILRDYHNDIEL